MEKTIEIQLQGQRAELEKEFEQRIGRIVGAIGALPIWGTYHSRISLLSNSHKTVVWIDLEQTLTTIATTK